MEGEKLMFRDLQADEVDVRASTVNENGVTLLLYKDARCDQAILDETVGALNWQRHHTRDNANCIVSIWDSFKNQWVDKEDTGKESNTEAEKGLASDSFKRACFNWGIGRELYTAPFIWVAAQNLKQLKPGKNGKLQCFDKFIVKKMTVEAKKITALVIVNQDTGKIVFSLGDPGRKEPPHAPKATTQPQDRELVAQIRQLYPGERIAKMLEFHNAGKLEDIPQEVLAKYVAVALKKGAPDGK